MKKIVSYLLTGVVGCSSAVLIGGCSAETPFDMEGMGTVRLHTEINALTTRAEDEADISDREKYLRENCVVYITSDQDGLVYKQKNLDQVQSVFSLKSGGYVAEAWSGDSVTASFDKMFFRGYERFDVSKNDQITVVVNCKIRNVVVSVNTATIDPNLISDYVITVKNSRGSLEFNKNNAGTDRAYFMMPNADNKIEYKILVTRVDGETFEKSSIIENVESAHNYILNFTYDNISQGGSGTGYAFFDIKIKDEDIDNGNVILPSAPTVTGVDFDIEKQLVYTGDDDIPDEVALKFCGFGDDLDEISIAQTSDFSFGENASSYQTNLNKGINMLKASGDAIDNYNHAGISWENPEANYATGVATSYVKLSKDFFKNLAVRDAEHIINFQVTDLNGRKSVKSLRIARSANAIVYEDPVVVQPIDTDSNPMSVTGTTATVTFSLGEDYEGTPGVEYRKVGDVSPEWSFAGVGAPAAAPRRTPWKAPSVHSVTLTGLETGSTYEYRACCGEFHGTDILSFTTESAFSLKEASFEDWSSYSAKTLLGTKNVTLPSATGDKITAFWGSGNEGSATANLTLTDKSTDMVHSGTYSARLESKSALGIIAAGNLFVGYYDKTDGTNGVLQLGREYNGSHPSAVRVYANYRPGNNVSVKSGNEEYIDDMKSGGTDQGHIYIALVDGVYEVRTNPSDRKLFDRNDEHVLAYGQVTWKEAFGPDGQLQLLEIPFEYNERAKTKRPTHVVIVCSASKFGDYFSGASGSVMYVDDFELVY